MWTAVVFSSFLVLTFVDPTLSEGNDTDMSNLEAKTSKFKANIHRIILGSRIRMKRQLEGSDPLIHKFKFGKVTPVDLPYLSDLSLTFWLSIESRNQVLIGTTDKRLILFEMLDEDKNALTVALSDAEIAIKARDFSYYDEQWFIVLHDSGGKYFWQLYQKVGRNFEVRQTVNLNGTSDIELISMKGMHYLVVVTYSTQTTQGFSYQASVTLYYWAQTQFDAIATRTTFGARSIACWILGGSLYIAIGQELNDEGNMEVGSPIYLYNSKEENNLVLWEMLATYGPSKVQHFYVAENHYVIFIGRHDAVIYWWSSGQFLEWQTLQGTAYALDVSILSLEDEIAIVIVLKEDALFYTLDASGHYVISFTMSFKGSSLLSLQFMLSGKNYYALALFEGSHAQSVWKLELESHYMPSIASLDPLRQCLLDTQEKLAQRKEELTHIKEDMKRIWLKGSNQTIVTKVIVQGRITSLKSVVRNVIILRYTNIPHMPYSVVYTLLTELKDSLEEAKQELRTVVLKSTRQDIRGLKYFTDEVFVPSLRIESTNNDISINDVRISRLKNYALRKRGNQVVPYTTVIANVFSETVNVEAINGISTHDLLLLHGQQYVTGNLIFAFISASNIAVGSINSIPVEEMVTTTTSQDIKDFKTFSQLKAHSVNVQNETNGVDLGAVYPKIATVDAYNEFTSHLSFLSPVAVSGSIYLTSKLNNIVDLSRFISQSVLKDSQQDLTGYFTFQSNQKVTNDLLVTDSINGVSIDNLLTLGSSQKVYADIVFSEPLKIVNDLILNTINGINLDMQALKKSLMSHFISGRKIFQKDITADFVDMSEYVTLDGVDPSFLVQDIIQHEQGIVNHTVTTFKDVEILGNVTAWSGINDYSIPDLLSSVWLKSTEQNISIPRVTAELIHLKNDMEAHTINGLILDEDVVSTFRDDEILSTKTFHSISVVKSLRTVGDVTVNGIHPKTLKRELSHLINESTVEGRKELSFLEIFGDLHVTKLSDLGIADIMHPSALQYVHGNVEFPDELTAVHGNARAGSLFFGHLNGLNLHDFFRRAVSAGQLPIPLTNKYFKDLKAASLYIPSSSKLAGVSLQEMQQRVVTLNTPQLVPSSKSFNSEINFSKAISTAVLNGLELSSYLDKVVLTDEVSKISQKHFLEDVQTTNAFVRGEINGVNIQEMAANVFYKSEDNEVAERFTFVGDVDLDNLLASAIDGVNWQDLVLLKNDEVLETGWFLSNVHAKQDVFITGLLNGCDLSQISSSIYSNKTSQVINKIITVDTVVIVGDLKVKNQINKIQLDILKNFITMAEEQTIESNVIIESGADIGNLIVTNLVDSTDVAFIMADAVRHSIPQDITGLKDFKENVNIAHLVGGDIFVQKLDGVDLEELKETSVSKTGYQEIGGDKIFPSLFVNVATVDGFLNGLRLPADVVRADATEHVSHPTYFMSDVYVPTEIVVHGLIDGVQVNEFIQQRITLRSDQNASSELVFYDDAMLKGELTIDGTINEIVLELVAKVKSLYPLKGYKVFVDFYVAGPLVAGLVNGYNLSLLNGNTLRYNKDDYVNGIQRFDKSINARNSMYAEWVNGVSITWLRDVFSSMISNLTPVLGYLNDLTSNLQQQLTYLLSATPDRASKFAYFILHQEINEGPASRILYGCDIIDDAFSHSLVMWTQQKHCIFMEKCCHLEFSYWLRVMKNGIVMVDGAEESGKYYPIQSRSSVTMEREFFVWTDATDEQPKSCSSKNSRMFLGSITNENSPEVFIDMENSPQLSDVKSFRKGHLYAVAAFYFDPIQGNYGSTVVYIYDGVRHWSEHETLPSFGVLSMDIISYTKNHKEDILLALGSGMNTVPTSYSSVYRWNNINRSFEILQTIPSRYVTSTLWIKGRDLLLSMANVDVKPNRATGCSELVSGGQIDIYLYQEKLQWIQSIPIGGVTSMVSFSSDGDIYLAAASIQLQNIYIFEWRGYSGFVEIQSISADAQHLNVYTIDDDIYMTVASLSGPSKILKMVRKGKQFSEAKNFEQTLEQKDEVPDPSKVASGC